MSEDRHHFVIRRRMDYSLILTFIGMCAALIVFTVKVVRAHAGWMDQITAIVVFNEETKRDWRPRIVALEKRQDVNDDRYARILEELKAINRKIGR